MNLLGVACALGAAVIWGGVYVVAKYVLDFIPPLTLVALRYAVALLVLGAIIRLTRARPVARADLPTMAVLGLVGFAISIVAQFAGTHLSTAANGALITTATPVLVAVFAYFILGEPLVLRHLLGLGLALAGVLVVSDPASANLSSDLLVGNALLVLASVTYALYSVLAKRASFRYSVLTVTTYATFFGLAFTAPFVPVEGALFSTPTSQATTPLVVAGVLYLGVVATAGAFYLWNKGMVLLDASAAAVCFFAQPVVGGLLGSLLLGESLGPAFFLGAALIFLGVGVVSVNPSRGRPAGIGLTEHR